jgi:hypothetical protein
LGNIWWEDQDRGGCKGFTKRLNEVESKGLDSKLPNCGAPPPPGALLVLCEGASYCVRDIFILKEIWAQNKIYNFVGTLLG